jgi:hypothetical protein
MRISVLAFSAYLIGRPAIPYISLFCQPFRSLLERRRGALKNDHQLLEYTSIIRLRLFFVHLDHHLTCCYYSSNNFMRLGLAYPGLPVLQYFVLPLITCHSSVSKATVTSFFLARISDLLLLHKANDKSKWLFTALGISYLLLQARV